MHSLPSCSNFCLTVLFHSPPFLFPFLHFLFSFLTCRQKNKDRRRLLPTRHRLNCSVPPFIDHTAPIIPYTNVLDIISAKATPKLSDHYIVIIDAELRPIFLLAGADIDTITQGITTDAHMRPLTSNWDSHKHTMEKDIPQKTPSRQTFPWLSRYLCRHNKKKKSLQTCADIQHSRKLDRVQIIPNNIFQKPKECGTNIFPPTS